ncbi:MAG: hypothetical protein ACI9EF_000234 [Pseudohongiellaceae bacterium]|jgi:hypothetical protein
MIVKAQLVVGYEARPGSTYLGESWSETDRLELKTAITDQESEWVSLAWRNRWADLDLTVDSQGHLAEEAVRAFILEHLEAFDADLSNPVQLFVEGGRDAPSAGVTYIFVNGQRVCIHNYLLTWQSTGGSGTPQPWIFNRFVGTAREFSTQLFIQLSWPTTVA